jgi:N-acetylmuramoyl-L-alanine amidase
LIENRSINGISCLVTIGKPGRDQIGVAHEIGSTVKDLGQAAGANVACNFNFADTVTGTPIGMLQADGKVVNQDNDRTRGRLSIYQDTAGKLHMGIPPINAVWSVQGVPPLLMGSRSVYEQYKATTPADVYNGTNYRTAAGIRSDGQLVIVRTISKVTLQQLADIMLILGCWEALNGDGGGSTYMWPEDNGWGRKMGSAITIKRGEDKDMDKRFLIAIDDGHGIETAGKRTPTLPDGTVMRENEFNRRVAHLLAEHLMRCGLEILLVSPLDVDTPLKVRTDTANKAKADLYISIHANASGSGGFNSARGIETYHYPGSTKGKKAAEVIHKHLIGGTKLPDRGVKSQDFHVLRETSMPAVLVECAFMTNLEDAKLLLTDAYREECAEELARGICEYFGVVYVDENIEPVKELPLIGDTVKVLINDQEIADGYIIEGRAYIPVRAAGDALGMEVGWDPETKIASLKGGK